MSAALNRSAASPACQAEPALGGQLVYLMGPSGSGKDTLLRALSTRLTREHRVLIAHRYITRASSPDEVSLSLSKEEFARRDALGCFALAWRSHALDYGIGIEIDTWMQSGFTVVVNGSREYLHKAAARYPHLRAVAVSVEPAVLAQRLAQRQRETAAQIAERLQRAELPYGRPKNLSLVQLDNSGAPERGAQALLDIVRAA